MPTSVLLHVVRHGRTRSNRTGGIMGWSHETIEPESVRAAEAVAARLASIPRPVRLLSSPLPRARDTAAPLAAALEVPIALDDRLGELHQGPWEGLTETDVERRWPDEWRTWRTTPETLELEGRETLVDLYARVAEVADELAAATEAASIVVFTHDAVVRAFAAWALDVGPATYRRIDVANCSITTIGVSTSGRKLIGLNDVSHLA